MLTTCSGTGPFRNNFLKIGNIKIIQTFVDDAITHYGLIRTHSIFEKFQNIRASYVNASPLLWIMMILSIYI